MTELYDAHINFDDFLLPTPNAMRTPSYSNSLPTSAAYPSNLFANPAPPTVGAAPPPFPPIVDANPSYPEYDPTLEFFSTQPTPSPPQPSSSLAIPFTTPSPNTATASFLPPPQPPALYSSTYHGTPGAHFAVPPTGSSGTSLFGTPALPPPSVQQQQHQTGTAATVATSSTSTVATQRRRKTSSPTPGTSPAIDKHKLEERRRKNRLSSSKCYYNRKKQIELVERTLTDEKKRAIQLYETELKLRQENARLKKELVLKNIRIPPSFMTTTRTEAFTRPSVL